MTILIIDDEPIFRQFLVSIFQDILGLVAVDCASYQEVTQLDRSVLASIDVAFIDMQMPIVDGFQAGASLKKDYPDIVSIMMTAFPSVDRVVKALRDHEFDDFIIKEDLEDVQELTQLKNALGRAERLCSARKALTKEYQLSEALRSRYTTIHYDFIGKSDFFSQTCQLIEKVAVSLSAILICGETGTGKELVAREIHEKSNRRLRPFIPLNCSAIPGSLLESELFGHKKGAFTGAVGNRDGYFKLAEGGTLFLDEIGDMPLELQSKLLRVLEEKRFMPVGSSNFEDMIQLDARIVSATNQDLEKKIEEGTFRRDLMYRLNTIVIPLKPLRERVEDISPLIDYFILLHRIDTSVEGILPEALALLKQWRWPGNIRELKNVIERAVLLCEGRYLSVDDFPSEIQRSEKTNGVHRNKEPHTRSETKVARSEAALPMNPRSQIDHLSLWNAFEANDYKLWQFSDPIEIRSHYREGLNGAVYQKKGHFAKLVVRRDFCLDVSLKYVCADACAIRQKQIRFEFFKTTSEPTHSRKKGHDMVSQPVLKGLPDTYLFNLLYPQVKRNDFSQMPGRWTIRALLLRYLMAYHPSVSLKTLIELTMPALTDQHAKALIEGLSMDGIDAMRAYLCAANNILAGVASTLKTEPLIIKTEIQGVFPDRMALSGVDRD